MNDPFRTSEWVTSNAFNPRPGLGASWFVVAIRKILFLNFILKVEVIQCIVVVLVDCFAVIERNVEPAEI